MPARSSACAACATSTNDDFAIWGILQSGPLWLRSAIGGRGVPSDLPPPALVVRASAPGRITVARAGSVIGELRGGRLFGPSMDVFASRWLAALFAESRQELIALHADAERHATTPWAPLDPDLTRLISQQMVKRIISTVQVARHGGTVIVLPPEATDAMLSDGRFVRLKYRFTDGEPRRRYRSLILSILRTLAETTPPEEGPADWGTYEQSRSPDIAILDEAVFEMSRLIAGLADVDGAVVMTKRFEVLGFAGEIIGGPVELSTVRRALDLEGARYELEPVDRVGTRHRSAYRLCEEIHDAVVIVISQDGGVRFVAWNDGAVTYWDHVPAGARSA